jgi:hypothetical protein
VSTPPHIVNLIPREDDSDFGLTKPIRFSLRDVETYVNPVNLHVTTAYAKIRSKDTELFDIQLPRTFRSSVLSGIISTVEPILDKLVDGVRITKTTNDPQKSVFFTNIDTPQGFKSVLVMASVRPDVVTSHGPVLGVENGPRSTAAYLFFEDDSGPQLRLAGPADASGTRVPNIVIPYDWSSGFWKYIIVWNEVLGQVQIHVMDNDGTELLHIEDISEFQQFDTELGSPTPRRGSLSEFTAVYGVEGPVGESVTIDDIAITADVGFPFVGLSRTGEFLTKRQSDETIRYEGGDPRNLEVAPWFGPDNRFFSVPDPSGVVRVLSEGVRLTKTTMPSSLAIYREEPGFEGSDTDGLFLEGRFFAIVSQALSQRITGMGFMVWDGASAFILSLIDGEVRNIGLLKSSGGIGNSQDHKYPNTPLQWSGDTYFRFTVDPRRGKVELFGDDLVVPILSMNFDRGEFPDGSTLGILSDPAFIAFGHIANLPTAGSFDLKRLTYSHIYQSYEARDGVTPDQPNTDPIWNYSSTGPDEELFGPLYGHALFGGGYGLTPLPYFITGSFGEQAFIEIVNDQLVITSSASSTGTFHRNAPFDDQRGAVLEIRSQITSWKPKSRTGFFMVIDDGIKSYILSFVDTDVGRFVGVATRFGLGGFLERVGTDGSAEKLSHKIDWTEPHIYRLERRPLDGLYLLIDGEEALVIPDSDKVDFPSSRFHVPTIAFGYMVPVGGQVKIDFVRAMFGSGYEISFKKVDSVQDLEESIRDTRAVVIAHAQDVD